MSAPAGVPREKHVAAGVQRRKEIYEALRNFKVDNQGRSPTFRELCDLTGVTSTSVIAFHLERLVDQGAIKLLGRSIQLVGEGYVAPVPPEIR